MTAATQTVSLDRVHRFAIDDLVRHVDDAPGVPGARVSELTLRIRDGVAYPTYTLVEIADPFGEPVEDVLCTVDLLPAS